MFYNRYTSIYLSSKIPGIYTGIYAKIHIILPPEVLNAKQMDD